MPSSGVFLCLDEGVLFGTGRIWRFHQCNKAYLDPLSSITNLVIEVGSHTRNCLDLVSTTVKMTGVDGTVNRKKAKYRKIVRHNLRNIIESRHLL